MGFERNAEERTEEAGVKGEFPALFEEEAVFRVTMLCMEDVGGLGETGTDGEDAAVDFRGMV